MDLMKDLLKESMKTQKSPIDSMRTKFEAVMLDLREAHDVLDEHIKDKSEFAEVVSELAGDKFQHHFKDLRMHLDAIFETLMDIEVEVDQATSASDDDGDDEDK